jgi:NAD(P)-dependent dehydrogenase (short-subunit alcohol dehydrogenase family)
VLRSAGRYRLNAATVQVDLWELRDLLTRANIAIGAARQRLLRAACDLYAAPLAAGCRYDWVEPYREKARRWGTEAQLPYRRQPARRASFLSGGATARALGMLSPRRAGLEGAMQHLEGRVAVITGAASGIGYALAQRFGAAGMKLVVADVEEPALDSASAALASDGYEVEPVPTDVSDRAQVDTLAERALGRFGSVHVVCNNAGVGTRIPFWEHTPEDWRWTLDVDLWGVIHGVQAFLPFLMHQGEPGHIVNTASVNGLLSSPGLGAYNVAKAGVVALSETLALELSDAGLPIRVSVVCPGPVRTRIFESERNRPVSYRCERERAVQAPAGAPPTGRDPADIADEVLCAVREDRFWVLTHPEFGDLIRERSESILTGRAPRVPWVP